MSLRDDIEGVFSADPGQPGATPSPQGGVVNSSPTDAPWDPPIPFGRYNLPDFPLEAIPERLRALRGFCAAVAESFQVPPDLPALLSLVVAGTALAKRVEVHIRGDWWEPVNLFVAVAMESGERKSGAFRVVSAPLSEFEQEENERLAPAIERNRAELAMLAAELKHAQSEAAKRTKPQERDAARKRVLELTERLRTAEVIRQLRLMADDATPEAVGRLLHEQGGRIALLSPEGDVFDLMGGRYSEGTPRLGVYLKGHAGDDYRLDRVSKDRPPEYVRRPALTVGLAVQPDVLRGLMQKPGFRGRGLLARFLYALPGSRVGYRELNPPSVPKRVADDYANLIRVALRVGPALDAQGKPGPHIVRVGTDALAELDRFRLWTESALRMHGDLAALRDWGSKLPGAVCRIAGIFHALVHASTGFPAAQQLDAETMLGAIAIGEYTVGHAKAAFCEMGANPATSLARRLLAWVTENRLTGFTRRDAFNELRGTVQRVDALDEPLRLLAEHGFIRERQTERSGPGRKPSTRYDVNPSVHAQNTHNAHNSGSPDDSAHSADCAQGVST